ncbi:NAD(FAD)-utilizing dehydrogenase [Rubellimicrobium mesophilum DSM 19309]|uniref:NAD(FAD)-utilizing dehydrogenase n=1 Tax=Rubellimicrobium mesophilum DSM 19309 TaxID=442562 RepID=A0A017HN83_9RHOB|nr:NAD(P)/FAD-dependent oxidoreductase [Rubellimicrobium mesophilum]EYD75244.1 NAD(FAD)-utilizing dehydrogenase [Rubellimicrobium mesophilum DSM 19309]
MEADTIILGAGAAGLFCAGRCGPGALVLDHASRPAEKVRISGGGRCNFTNLHARPEAFLSANPHFAKSALASYTAQDFLALVESHRIPWHEKTLGQLFCDRSSRDIIALLLAECDRAGARVQLSTVVTGLSHDGTRFTLATVHDGRHETLQARRLVVATGGKSIPKMGATGLAYRIAEQFGLPITETRPALVPFTFGEERFGPLAGVAVPVRARANGPAFDEAMLFTHRGLSGPAMLQASSYWREGEDLAVSLLPGTDWAQALREAKREAPKQSPKTALARHLPARLADHLASELHLSGNLAGLSDARLDALARSLSDWRLKPTGTEGYRTAEVTLGGIDTKALDSRTLEAKAVPNLFFIGECVDVTGWLGGYNFQWAWSSADAAARAIRARA